MMMKAMRWMAVWLWWAGREVRCVMVSRKRVNHKSYSKNIWFWFTKKKPGKTSLASPDIIIHGTLRSSVRGSYLSPAFRGPELAYPGNDRMPVEQVYVLYGV